MIVIELLTHAAFAEFAMRSQPRTARFRTDRRADPDVKWVPSSARMSRSRPDKAADVAKATFPTFNVAEVAFATRHLCLARQ